MVINNTSPQCQWLVVWMFTEPCNTRNSETIEYKNDDFFNDLLLPTVTILARNHQMAITFSFKQIKLLKAYFRNRLVAYLLNLLVYYGSKLGSHFARNLRKFGVTHSEELSRGESVNSTGYLEFE